MIRSLALVAAAGLAVAALAAPAAAQDNAQGVALFTSQHCALCHAIAGKGNKKGVLDGVGSKLTADEIREWITNPVEMREKAKATRTPAMPKKALSKTQVDALVAYLASLKG